MPERPGRLVPRAVRRMAAAALARPPRALAGHAPPAPAGGLVASCLQCGRDRVDIVAVAGGRARVSCRACGAVMSQDTVRLRSPAGGGRSPSPPAADRAVPPQAHPLAPYVSAELLAWARATGRDSRAGAIDKAAIYRLWKEFDRARTGPSLPAFGEIVGLLHAGCYREALAICELASDEGGPARRAAVEERVGCARRWLAGPGRAHCWIERRADGAAIAAVDRRVVRSLLEPDALDGTLTAQQREALYLAAFGTSGGPPTRALLRCFAAETILQALQTHLLEGGHPLRPTVLAALEGRDADGRVRSPQPAAHAARC